ncbi:hypothetical protein [Devosia sp. Root635]|uniref:hypothetical protein n=1 Tax=Devosia sp. Root635 TaxID=1736575 RepID=UPI0006F22034|nr:hypothetical protein [Devosia sp. Root635]KRA41681.1 hypothetical protein ASD80_11580 [Devosia sp. Root635]
MIDIEALQGMLGTTRSIPMPSEAVYAKLSVSGLRMERTCSAAPEQYEIFRGDDAAGYIRVRWSRFTVDYPSAGDEILFDGSTDGFAAFTDSERDSYLLMAIDLILSRLDAA